MPPGGDRGHGYLELRLQVPEHLEHRLPDILVPWPVLGTLIEPATDGLIDVAIFVDAAEAAAVAEIEGVFADLEVGEISVATVPEGDWLARYREHAVPFAVGERWWIDPRPDHPTPPPDGRHRLVIEPGMAFGSGSHESTQLILSRLEREDVAGRDVLDVGTGSGILALAADRLGGRRVTALDIDPESIWVARHVLGQQEWSPAVDLILGPVSCLAGSRFDLILCNMISAHFLVLLGELRPLLGTAAASVLFSGILSSEANLVAEALESENFAVANRLVSGEWVCFKAVAVA